MSTIFLACFSWQNFCRHKTKRAVVKYTLYTIDGIHLHRSDPFRVYKLHFTTTLCFICPDRWAFSHFFYFAKPLMRFPTYLLFTFTDFGSFAFFNRNLYLLSFFFGTIICAFFLMPLNAFL